MRVVGADGRARVEAPSTIFFLSFQGHPAKFVRFRQKVPRLPPCSSKCPLCFRECPASLSVALAHVSCNWHTLNHASPCLKAAKTKDESHWMKRHAELKEKKRLHEAPMLSSTHCLHGLKHGRAGLTRERDCVVYSVLMSRKASGAASQAWVWMSPQAPASFCMSETAWHCPWKPLCFTAGLLQSRSFSASELRDLIGESMALPTLGMALICCLSALNGVAAAA